MSADIARRIGMEGAASSRARRTLPVPRREAATHSRRVTMGPAARYLLWRDASLVLLVGVTVILLAQLPIPGLGGGTGQPSHGPGQSDQVVLDATGRPAGSGLPSIGPVVAPSLIRGIEQTPTPVPTGWPHASTEAEAKPADDGASDRHPGASDRHPGASDRHPGASDRVADHRPFYLTH